MKYFLTMKGVMNPSEKIYTVKYRFFLSSVSHLSKINFEKKSANTDPISLLTFDGRIIQKFAWTWNIISVFTNAWMITGRKCWWCSPSWMRPYFWFCCSSYWIAKRTNRAKRAHRGEWILSASNSACTAWGRVTTNLKEKIMF